jgi:hypothetical protein
MFLFTLMDVISCQVPESGLFFSDPTFFEKNGHCPLEANTREVEDPADCKLYLFWALVTILLPMICYCWLLKPCVHPTVFLLHP